MPDHSRRVCPPIDLLTDMDVRELLAHPVGNLISEHTADRAGMMVGCDGKTLHRAHNRETTLKLATAFNLLAADRKSLNRVLAHYGMMAVTIPTAERADPAVNVAILNAQIAQAKAVNSPGGERILDSEIRAMSIDECIEVLQALKGQVAQQDARNALGRAAA